MKNFLAFALTICVVFWIFESEFLILDILFLELLVIGFYILIPLVLLIIVVWVIKELFN